MSVTEFYESLMNKMPRVRQITGTDNDDDAFIALYKYISVGKIIGENTRLD